MPAFTEETFSQRVNHKQWIPLIKRAREHKGLFIKSALAIIFTGIIDALWPLLNGIAVDRFVVAQSTEGLLGFVLLYCALAVLLGVCIWLLIIFSGRLEINLVRTYRRQLFVHLQHLSMSYFDKTATGWLMTRLTSDIQRLGDVISWGIVDILWSIIMMIGVATAMLILNAKLALMVLSVLPPLILISYYFQRRILTAHRKVRKLNSEISASFNEGIIGTPTTKTLVRERENLAEFSQLTGHMRTASIRAALFSSVYLPIVLLIGSIGMGIAVVAGGIQLTTGLATLGTIIAFIGYTFELFEPVRDIARILTEFQAAQSAVERISSLLNTSPSITETPQAAEQFGTVLEPRNKKSWPKCTGEVHFDSVTFHYTENEPVLENFDLHIPAGQSIALVGETGAGKTTIVNLASRFYEPVSGRILIDGTDYKERSQSWLHSNLGYVLQDPFVFQGSLRDNICYANPSASDKEVIAVTKLVALHEIITNLSDGYNHKIGEGGAGLSTGEKQLVSFARALLADPAILILDEATSSVDTQAEIRIQKAISALLKNRTSLIIAHRLSTVRNADRIVMLEHGKIIEDGSHDELIQKREHYYKLYTEQFTQ